MKNLLLFILNLPFTLTGVVPLIASQPTSFRLIKDPIALVFEVKSFWWGFAMYKNARAMTIGHLILMSPKQLKNDFEHEIIHVHQCQRYPVVFPFLYLYELIRRGYRYNRFEDEAYTLSNSIYTGSAVKKIL